jgi:hypothetical protein
MLLLKPPQKILLTFAESGGSSHSLACGHITLILPVASYPPTVFTLSPLTLCAPVSRFPSSFLFIFETGQAGLELMITPYPIQPNPALSGEC